MSNTTYTIKIKKEYASAILEDLQQVNAIEIVEEPVPEWQKEETLRRLSHVKAVISRIKLNPHFASVKFADIRTAACTTFPYAIHYEIDEEDRIVRIVS